MCTQETPYHASHKCMRANGATGGTYEPGWWSIKPRRMRHARRERKRTLVDGTASISSGAAVIQEGREVFNRKQLKPRLASVSEPGRGLSLSQQRVYPIIIPAPNPSAATTLIRHIPHTHPH